LQALGKRPLSTHSRSFGRDLTERGDDAHCRTAAQPDRVRRLIAAPRALALCSRAARPVSHPATSAAFGREARPNAADPAAPRGSPSLSRSATGRRRWSGRRSRGGVFCGLSRWRGSGRRALLGPPASPESRADARLLHW